MSNTVIYWFRHDLRLSDLPGLQAASLAGNVIPVFIHDENLGDDWAIGGASQWWLHHSLTGLADSLAALGLPFIVRQGESLMMLDQLIAETGATAVHWNRLYDPALIRRDKAIKAELQHRGLEVHSHNAALLHEPWTIQTGTGGDYKAFPPFGRACRRQSDPALPLPVPASLQA